MRDNEPPSGERPKMIRSTQSTVKPLPKRLCIGIGGYFGPCYGVTLEKGRLIYTYSARGPSGGDSDPELELRQKLGLSPFPEPDEIQPSPRQWRNFRRTLDRLNVWCWQANYPNSGGVCDGTGWSVEIVYSDRSLVSSGDNCFPGWDGRAVPITAAGASRDNTFAKFCRAVSRLIGREFH
jgi:hypothetical protein